MASNGRKRRKEGPRKLGKEWLVRTDRKCQMAERVALKHLLSLEERAIPLPTRAVASIDGEAPSVELTKMELRALNEAIRLLDVKIKIREKLLEQEMKEARG